MAGADHREPDPVRLDDMADLHQVARQPHHHVDRQHQLRHLEHPLPRRHHLLKQQGRQEEHRRRPQTPSVRATQSRD